MAIKIINYKSDYAQDFYNLNIEWLNTFFYVEPYDEKVLRNPETYIINRGGCIFFAQRDQSILGAVALMPTPEAGILELTKMAVLPNERGHKIGQQLLQHCIDFSKTNTLKGLLLYSNTKLENAIYLYRKYGFKELKLEKDNPYERADIKMFLSL